MINVWMIIAISEFIYIVAKYFVSGWTDDESFEEEPEYDENANSFLSLLNDRMEEVKHAFNNVNEAFSNDTYDGSKNEIIIDQIARENLALYRLRSAVDAQCSKNNLLRKTIEHEYDL